MRTQDPPLLSRLCVMLSRCHLLETESKKEKESSDWSGVNLATFEVFLQNDVVRVAVRPRSVCERRQRLEQLCEGMEGKIISPGMEDYSCISGNVSKTGKMLIMADTAQRCVSGGHSLWRLNTQTASHTRLVKTQEMKRHT